MRRRIPGLQDRIAQVVTADVLALRRPALDQQRRDRPRFRAALQQLSQPPGEQPVPSRLLRKTRGQHAHPHMLALAAGTDA